MAIWARTTTRSRSSIAFMLAVAAVLAACSGAADETGDSSTAVDVSGDPQLAEGRELFVANCAQCHGAELTGTDSGPPLLHEFYVPSHHPDEAFQAAMELGVSPHHWDFGPMPPRPDVDTQQAELIIDYVRAAQREAGLIEE